MDEQSFIALNIKFKKERKNGVKSSLYLDIKDNSGIIDTNANYILK